MRIRNVILIDMGHHLPVKNIKVICDPLWGIIDITDFLPLVDVPEFQALGFKYQLGVTNIVFPSATHTRKQHSFGAFKRTQDATRRLASLGLLDEADAKMLCAFALWHDIGHGPFSHVVEEVTKELYGREHKDNCIAIVDRYRELIVSLGIDFDSFRKLFTHEHPLHVIVSDKNLGTEKLDYLARDAYYTLAEVPGIEYLATHTYFVDGKLAIDEKAIDQAKVVQEFYVHMYKNVYLRKNSSIAQRMIQKMTAELLRARPMSEEQFWALTDFGLLGLYETSESPVVQDLYGKFMRRQLPKTAIALRPTDFASIEHRSDKAQVVFGVEPSLMQKIMRSPHFATPGAIEKIEARVEELSGLPPKSVVVTPPISPERFVPQDVHIYKQSGQIAQLSDYFGEHFRAIEEEGRSYAVLRVCTFKEYRSTLAQPDIAARIKDYMLGLVG